MFRLIQLRLSLPLLVLAVPLILALSCSGGDGEVEQDFGVESELVTEAEFPVTLAFTPDGRLFYNELLNGNVRVIMPDGKLLPEPFLHVDVGHPNARPRSAQPIRESVGSLGPFLALALVLGHDARQEG